MSFTTRRLLRSRSCRGRCCRLSATGGIRQGMFRALRACARMLSEYSSLEKRQKLFAIEVTNRKTCLVISRTESEELARGLPSHRRRPIGS